MSPIRFIFRKLTLKSSMIINTRRGGQAFVMTKEIIDSATKAFSIKSMNSNTFSQTVRDVVASLQRSGQTVTALDVTQTLRNQVNIGQLRFCDRHKENVDGTFTFRVTYEEVRDEIASLFNAGEMTGYVKGYDTQNGYSFTIYKLDSASILPPTAAATPTAIASGGTSFTTTGALPDYRKLIADYVSQHPNVTVKRIQSRLKRTPLKSDEIIRFAQQLGFSVQNATPHPSKAVIS